ncbi:MAG TPA: hypothetical protein VF631_12815 [Allosphingosinicella sp.]|jgi:hypothetical protein|uniref:hypothetical protein n=1 Tax=Allosphingosinicella sp. TaxID=2823234 RepID=UPI002F2A38DE
MSKPPPSTPHSDIDGVHAHERRHTDVAAEQGDSAETLKRAAADDKARPLHVDDKENLDDRTR